MVVLCGVRRNGETRGAKEGWLGSTWRGGEGENTRLNTYARTDQYIDSRRMRPFVLPTLFARFDDRVCCVICMHARAWCVYLLPPTIHPRWGATMVGKIHTPERINKGEGKS